MKSTTKMLLTCLAIMGLVSSAVADTNNAGGAGEQQGQQGPQGGPGAQGHRHGPGRACRADVEKFCQGVQPGEGRIIACLNSNSSSLSSECSERLAKASKRRGQGQGQGQMKGEGEGEGEGEGQN